MRPPCLGCVSLSCIPLCRSTAASHDPIAVKQGSSLRAVGDVPFQLVRASPHALFLPSLRPVLSTPLMGNVVRAFSSNSSHGPRQGLPRLIPFTPFTPYPVLFIRTTAHRPSHQQLFVRALLSQLPKEGADCLGLPTSLFLIADSSGLKHASHTINSAPPDPYLSHGPHEPMACPSVCLSVHSRGGEPLLRSSSTGHSWVREAGRRRL